MLDRSELVEAALEVYPEGLALLNSEARVVFWNRAAEVMTGYASPDLLGRVIPDGLGPLTMARFCETESEPRNGPQPGRGSLVHVEHKRGHDVPALARRIVLRDVLGQRIGTAVVFHPGEPTNALPHGETSDSSEVRQSQVELEDRLAVAHEAFLNEGVSFGVLWVGVDQGQTLRKTHGERACETMLEAIERTLANGLRQGEEVGRWGDDEFLVISHQPASPDHLAKHAQVLTGLARTACFRWWGDRISLTVSIGAAAVRRGETLPQLLERAQSAMLASIHAGGNRITLAPERLICSPS